MSAGSCAALPSDAAGESRPTTERLELGITGPMTARTSRSLHVAFRRLVDGGGRHLVVDLSRVADIDPAGLAVLLVYSRLLRSLGGALELTAISSECRQLFARMPAPHVRALTEAMSP